MSFKLRAQADDLYSFWSFSWNRFYTSGYNHYQFSSLYEPDSFFPLRLCPLNKVLSLILSLGFYITPVWAKRAANSHVKNSSPLKPSNPSTLSFITPSMKIHRVGSVLIANFCIKNGDFSALMYKNWVWGNCWQRSLRCLSIILHLWKSLW